MSVTRFCGRPKRHGGFCMRPLLWYETACPTHATPADNAEATERLRQALAYRLAHETCPCPCHAVVQPGLVPCPRCAP